MSISLGAECVRDRPVIFHEPSIQVASSVCHLGRVNNEHQGLLPSCPIDPTQSIHYKEFYETKATQKRSLTLQEICPCKAAWLNAPLLIINQPLSFNNMLTNCILPEILLKRSLVNLSDVYTDVYTVLLLYLIHSQPIWILDSKAGICIQHVIPYTDKIKKRALDPWSRSIESNQWSKKGWKKQTIVSEVMHILTYWESTHIHIHTHIAMLPYQQLLTSGLSSDLISKLKPPFAKPNVW